MADEEMPSTWADDVWISYGFHPDHGEVRLIGDINTRAVNRVVTALFLCRSGVRFLVNSPGGGVEDGKAIYDLVRTYKAKKECLIVGEASSMAAAVVQAFDRRVIMAGAHLLLHDGTVSAENHAREFEQTALQSKRDRHWYYQVLAKRTGQSPQYWAKVCMKASYFSAKEALKAGLVDQVI